MSAAPSVRANDIEPSPPQLRGSLSVTITIAANSSPSTSSPASTSTRTVRTSRSGDGARLLPGTTTRSPPADAGTAALSSPALRSSKVSPSGPTAFASISTGTAGSAFEIRTGRPPPSMPSPNTGAADAGTSSPWVKPSSEIEVGDGSLPWTAAAAARPPAIATPPATSRATGPKPRELRREPRRAAGPAVTAVRPPWRTRGEATDPWCHRPRCLAATPPPRPVPSTRDRFAPAWPGPNDGPRRAPGPDPRGRPGALRPGRLPPRLDGRHREQRRGQQAGPVPALPQQAGPVPGRRRPPRRGPRVSDRHHPGDGRRRRDRRAVRRPRPGPGIRGVRRARRDLVLAALRVRRHTRHRGAAPGGAGVRRRRRVDLPRAARAGRPAGRPGRAAQHRAGRPCPGRRDVALPVPGGEHRGHRRAHHPAGLARGGRLRQGALRAGGPCPLRHGPSRLTPKMTGTALVRDRQS